VDHAGCIDILAKSGIADLKKLNVPLDTYYYCQNYNFMLNFKVKLTCQQSKMSQIHSNNKIAIVRTTKLWSPRNVVTMAAATAASTNNQPWNWRCWSTQWYYEGQPSKFHQCWLLSSLFCFSNLIERAPQLPWLQWWWQCWAEYPTVPTHIWQIAS
jgi:hypothetical protein